MKGKRVANKKSNKKLNKRRSGFIILIFILIFVNVKLIQRNNTLDTDNIQNQEDSEKVYKEKIVNRLAEMNERDRIEYYFATFVNKLEAKEYESAYDLLYDEFKKNYFPTLEEFTSYAEKTFPTMMNIEHENIERNGEVYVLWIYISDMLNGGPDDKKALNVVVREDALNEFVLSFSVI